MHGKASIHVNLMIPKLKQQLLYYQSIKKKLTAPQKKTLNMLLKPIKAVLILDGLKIQ